MSCCGKGREAFTSIRHNAPSAPASAQRRGSAQPAVIFEYTGNDSLSVTGTVTGIRYEFRGYGARARVDLRDRPQLARQPGLRMVM